ncbi:MAG: Hsp33 family molecular chaperone HslO [Candidatus Cloacimonas sp.]|nr:Hsp33 family molecular chaperone HslO [Candidatus Cloacimonas sp.]
MINDLILRGTAHNDTFRVFAVQNTAAVQKARDLHDLSPIATILLGRMLSAVAMMSWDLKHPEAEVTLRVDGEGPLAGAVAICTAQGFLRGYAFNPRFFLDNATANFLPGKAIGHGKLSIIRNDTNKQAFTGTCELISGEIAEDLAHYYAQSEQIPTAVNLGVLIDKEAKIRASGGFIIQQLPFAEPAIAEIIQSNIATTPNISDLMDMGLDLEEILMRFVFKGLQWKKHEEKQLLYHCSCTRERFSRALLLLGAEELQEMQEGIKPVCQYCGTEYAFSHTDMLSLINELKVKP